jgi:hypothetical protein
MYVGGSHGKGLLGYLKKIAYSFRPLVKVFHAEWLVQTLTKNDLFLLKHESTIAYTTFVRKSNFFNKNVLIPIIWLLSKQYLYQTEWLHSSRIP